MLTCNTLELNCQCPFRKMNLMPIPRVFSRDNVQPSAITKRKLVFDTYKSLSILTMLYILHLYKWPAFLTLIFLLGNI